MDELVKRISQQTGLPEEQARAAAQVAINFLKEKLPPPVAGQIDAVLGGGGGNLGDLGAGLGGILGRK